MNLASLNPLKKYLKQKNYQSHKNKKPPSPTTTAKIHSLNPKCNKYIFSTSYMCSSKIVNTSQ